jgi:hypothetical protein
VPTGRQIDNRLDRCRDIADFDMDNDWCQRTTRLIGLRMKLVGILAERCDDEFPFASERSRDPVDEFGVRPNRIRVDRQRCAARCRVYIAASFGGPMLSPGLQHRTVEDGGMGSRRQYPASLMPNPPL